MRKAVAMLEEAEQKLAATRKYVTVMRREQQNFKGGVQRFYTCVEADVPGAIAQLSGMLATLKEYVATGPASAVSEATGGNTPAASMARGEAADEGMMPTKPAEQPGAGGVDKKEGEA